MDLVFDDTYKVNVIVWNIEECSPTGLDKKIEDTNW